MMSPVKRHLRAGSRRVAERVAPNTMASVSRVRPVLERAVRQDEELAALRTRVAGLEQEIQECRRLNRRLAEVVDVVEQLLVPAADRDDARLRRALDSYAREM
jgi:hypothetical protein